MPFFPPKGMISFVMNEYCGHVSLYFCSKEIYDRSKSFQEGYAPPLGFVPVVRHA